METSEKLERFGGIYNYFQGATIHNLVINGNMTKNGSENFQQSETSNKNRVTYSDEQVARALANIVGKGKPIDSRMKWAGAQWLLRWRCNYPPKAQDFCDRINLLPFEGPLEFPCEYNNIRALSTLSFMNEDATHLENVKYSKNDEDVFFKLREVVIALDRELLNTLMDIAV